MRAVIHVVVRILWYVTGIVEVLLALRLASFLLGASSSALVVSLLYHVTDAVLIPFAGIFKNVSLGGASVLDLVALTALFGYLIGAFLVSELLGLFSRRLLPPRPNV